jgi:hypothetical protein
MHAALLENAAQGCLPVKTMCAHCMLRITSTVYRYIYVFQSCMDNHFSGGIRAPLLYDSLKNSTAAVEGQKS